MSRLQLALNVNDLNESIAFYSKLFGAEPAKVRDGYANFAIAQPPLKLVLIENAGHGGSINHLGVEVADTDIVDAEQARLAEVGLDVDRRTRHHLLLRPARQVLGAEHTQRRAMGDLRRSRRLHRLRLRPRRGRHMLTDRRRDEVRRLLLGGHRSPEAAVGRRHSRIRSAAGAVAGQMGCATPPAVSV